MVGTVVICITEVVMVASGTAVVVCGAVVTTFVVGTNEVMMGAIVIGLAETVVVAIRATGVVVLFGVVAVEVS